jgi:formylglycine-generating enzyme required for sulfatase activity
LRLFVCHASEDKPRVRGLVRWLREDGFDPWLDEERLLPGHDWQHEIATAVSASDVVVVCLSKTAVSKSGYVQKELRRALDVAEYKPEGAIFVIPVRLEECPVPARLSQWHYADLFVENGYERLREPLNGRERDRNERPAPASPPPRDPGRHRRPRIPTRWIAVACILVAGAIAGIVWHNWRQNQNSGKEVSTSRTADVEPAGMVRIPGASFMMGQRGPGDPDASAHEVTVGSFYLDRVPVTNARFREFLRSSNRVSQSTAADAPAERDQWPVTRVNWHEAAAYCLAQGRRLPSEAEWEFAARGTQGRLYPWGETFNPPAVNSHEARIGHPEPVGSRPLNISPHGVTDMAGNVWQWCADDYKPYPGSKPGFNIPAGAKVIRGGSFQSDRLHVTTVTRNLELPSTRSSVIGFRCAK